MRFQWLKDFQDLQDQILYLKWNLNKSKLELNRWIYGDLSDVRLDENSRSSSLEESIQLIEQEIEVLEEQSKEMLDIIESFKGIENQIVRLKYIDGLNLDQIAEEIGYSASYTRKKHADIRGKLDFLDEYEAQECQRLDRISEIEYCNEKKPDDKQISLF
ncbi:hypothetical protein [Enterococcus malodoratus]|uniref:hypothetical protein n=1 Tax=Enterococcus malodoratus TaxID=71451 RepID=UPI0039AF6D45